MMSSTTLPPELILVILEHCSIRELCAVLSTSSSSPWAVLAKEDGIWEREAARLRLRRRPVVPLYREVITTHARFGLAMSALPPPTSEQLINFVEHMASAHSWYKHLANCAPRDFFQVRVSPTAGMRHHVTGRCPGAGCALASSTGAQQGQRCISSGVTGSLNGATGLGTDGVAGGRLGRAASPERASRQHGAGYTAAALNGAVTYRTGGGRGGSDKSRCATWERIAHAC